MKKQLIILVLATVLVIVGCNKFEHESVEAPLACDLCSFAQGIEGTYRGEIHGDPPSGPYVDSVTMTVEQVFMNNNSYDDSTTMYFATTHTMDTQGAGTEYDTIQIRTSEGDIWFPRHEVFNMNGLAGMNTDYWIRNDTINRKLRFSTPFSSTMITYEGFLLKQ